MDIKSVLITGGCGFVGRRIIQQLRDKYSHAHITVIDLQLPLSDEQVHGVEYREANVLSLDSLRSVFAASKRQFQSVIHCVGLSPPLSERYARRIEKLVFQINVEGTRNMLLAAQEANVETFIYTSSICAVTDDFSKSYANIDERWPLVQRGRASSYGESKAEAETLVLQASSSTFKTCALRLPVVFGEGDTQFLPNIINCILHKDESPYRLGDGTNLWDTVYVGNAAHGHILAMENLLSDNSSASGEAFFITNQEPVSSRDFMLQTWKQFNGHIPSFEIGIPVQMAWLIGFFFEVYTWMSGKPTAISRGSVADAIAMRYTNGDKARRILGYMPVTGLEDGLQKSCQVDLT